RAGDPVVMIARRARVAHAPEVGRTIDELQGGLSSLLTFVVGLHQVKDRMERLERVRLLDQLRDLLLDGRLLPLLRDQRSSDQQDPETHRGTSLEGRGFYSAPPLRRGSPRAASRPTTPPRACVPSRALRSRRAPSSDHRAAPA